LPVLISSCSLPRPPPRPTLFPYTTLFRSHLLETRRRIHHRHHTGRNDIRVLAHAKFRSRHTRHDRFHNRHCAGVCTRTQATFLRSEEHTSELQSRENLVCRLLLEKKKKQS